VDTGQSVRAILDGAACLAQKACLQNRLNVPTGTFQNHKIPKRE
jgi:hypothetical protein